MATRLKVEELLKGEELEQLRAFTRERVRTIDEVHEWLQAHGYTCSRGAAYSWKLKDDQERQAERMSGSGSLARVFMDAARSDGGLQIPDAAVLQVAQMVFERGAEMAANGEATPDDLNKMALAMQRLMLAKARLEATRTEFVDREKKALEAAEHAVREGKSGTDVVSKVREILGIAA